MTYTVSAALLADSTCDFTGDYWDAGTFDTYDEAYKVWNTWMPPENEVHEACESHGEDVYTLNVGIYDESGEVVDLEDGLFVQAV